jgi:rhamnose utilization protein RhaD (predicted bifunctional aldolase and dehydrogenase)
MDPFEAFLKISHYAGKHPEFVQGGGGNTSVKDPGTDRMFIKSSGCRLSDISKSTGFVLLSIKTKEQAANFDRKPSIETPMHFLLGQYVIHTHPITVGIIVCDSDGPEKLKKLFVDNGFKLLYMDYASPGPVFAQELAKELKNKKCDVFNDTLVIFIQNHGLIVSANSPEKAIETHELIVNTIEKEYPPIEAYKVPADIYLTPEQALYENVTEMPPEVVAEMEHFKKIVYGSVLKYGTLHTLAKDEVTAMLKHPAEEHRIRIAKQKN